MEPWENLTVDVETENQGKIMEELGRRGGELQDMVPDGKGRVRLDYNIPSRGLIGFQMEFMTLTRGTGIKSHVFDVYAPVKGELPARRNGVLVSSEQGDARLRARAAACCRGSPDIRRCPAPAGSRTAPRSPRPPRRP